MEYFEIDFKEGTNVNESIESMVRQILDKERNPVTQQSEPISESGMEDFEQKSEVLDSSNSYKGPTPSC